MLTYRVQKFSKSHFSVLVAALLMGAATIYWLGRSNGGSTDAQLMRSYGCDVTRPNGKEPPGIERSTDDLQNGAWHGEDGLWLALTSKSAIVAVKRPPPPQGTYPGRYVGRESVYVKMGWFRESGLPGLLRVTATRVDAQSAQVTADLNPDYNSRGSTTVPGSLVFPTPGCWRLDAKQGDRALTFFVAVVRPPLNSGTDRPR